LPRSPRSCTRGTRAAQASSCASSSFSGRNEEARFRVVEEIRHLAALVGRIQRQEDATGAQAAEIQVERFGRLLHLRGDAVALLQAGFDEQGAVSRRLTFQLGIADAPAVGQDQAGGVGVLRKAGGECGEEVVVHFDWSGSHMTISGKIASSTI
jgi:hypothetical protein